MKALIIGGSIAGLFAALLLRRRGVDVVVFERARSELSGRGAGIATHPQILEVLELLGLDTRELGVTIDARRMFGPDGRLVAEHARRQTMTSWDRLFTLLRAALPDICYRRGLEFARWEQHGGAVTAHFADRSTATGELLIGADGLRSHVRAAILANQPLRYAGYVAWRALAPEHSFPPALHRDLFDALGFCLPPGEQMLGYPVAGPGNDLRPGNRRYNIVWYRPADEATLARLLTDISGQHHEVSIPPPLVAGAVIAELNAAADTLLAPQFRDVMSFAERPFLQPIYDIEVPRMSAGRIVLIGDAAFVARPHVGAGVVKAAQDAVALADALATGSDIGPALHAFESVRLPVGRRIVARARDLGAAMQAQHASPRERAMAERYREPAAVLADTATLEFL
ncbi:MAG: FAD-dependent oxidoreductase [Xanthobacteraceae bacterium]|jgi:2-polyprenyl-6-methoxyphenol hydroxylase-like FAD-dependent oxidoreductase